MDMIDRYAHEVGQHLPHRLRADVEAELRSLLADAVEEKARQGGVPAGRELQASVLRDFGRPQDVAARYAPGPQYLIGPRLYPAYLTAVKVMLPILAALIVAVVAAGGFLAPGEEPSLTVFVRATGRFLWSALENLGVLTLVFALVERAMRQREPADQAFDPAALPPVNDPDRVSYFGRIVALYLIALLAVAFNVFPGWVAVPVFHGSEGAAHPLLAPGFGRYLPALNVWWGLAFLLNLAVLRRGRWTRPTRWLDFGLELGLAAILLRIVTGPPAFAYDRPIKVVLGWVLGFTAVSACVMLFRLLRRQPAEPWAAA
ncbi:MAG TPA: hypothetical protein PKZ08_02520 [Vicinamibacterales bacterium]|nr:hypothetical protein [Vicinamibacterales bacterium]